MGWLSDDSPAVSVLMPVHNGVAWVLGAIDSVLRQSLTDLELVIVDDGSTDGSPEAIDCLVRRDRRIRVLRQRHLGVAAALNRGLEAARAPLVARLDADDTAETTRLARQAAFLEHRRDVGLVGTWAYEIDGYGRVRGRRTPDTDSRSLKRWLEEGNPFIHSSVMARTELLRALGGYRAAFQAAEDYDLWLRVAEVSEVANLPEFLVSYRMHTRGVSRRDGLRQAFSVRLAQRASTARRERANDPADELDGPPDWRCARDEAFYAEDAGLYRWLDVGLGETIAGTPIEAGSEGLVYGARRLNHAERRLAALALLTRVRSADPDEAAGARDLLVRLFRGSPAAVLKAAWSLRA